MNIIFQKRFNKHNFSKNVLNKVGKNLEHHQSSNIINY